MTKWCQFVISWVNPVWNFRLWQKSLRFNSKTKQFYGTIFSFSGTMPEKHKIGKTSINS